MAKEIENEASGKMIARHMLDLLDGRPDDEGR